MMWGYGTGMGLWGFVLMAVSNVLFWGLIIAGAVLLVRYLARSDRPAGGGLPDGRGTPEQTLAARFAAGEIDEEEYRHRLDVLRQRRPAEPEGVVRDFEELAQIVQDPRTAGVDDVEVQVGGVPPVQRRQLLQRRRPAQCCFMRPL